ncbi:MAG: ABC transporter permease [Bacteroidetes bacterium HGW-Bacteroidetes-11]|jgi:ABC-2 type transport system permease protein|nr:MAG: ABC transporter permease [Bacteroidetes bacterium HGW-Bacteroidetes-11]
MNKIILVIQREYLSRVKKKSFIVMTILGPILMAALFIVPVFLSQMSDEVKQVNILDETGWFMNKFEDSERFKFNNVFTDLETAKTNLSENKGYALVYIPKPEVSVPSTAMIFSEKQVSVDLKGYIRTTMSKEVENQKLGAEIMKEIRKVNPDFDPANPESSNAGNVVSEEILKNIKTNIILTSIRMGAAGKEEKSFTEVSMVVGLFAGILIYFFIFLFGSQVMRGVIEEKVSRIVEVIVSSVKPFQLMMGKIIGVGLVGLTQFMLWVVLTLLIVGVFQQVMPDKFQKQQTVESFSPGTRIPAGAEAMESMEKMEDQGGMDKMIEAIQSINYGVMIFSFLFYFLGGYLLYGAMFAAIGAAVDNETDTQQFMMPVTIPLILAIVVSQFVINNPEGPVAFWFSMIPFTSPIVMMVRIPFGVPSWEIALSMSLLVITFVAAVWMAGRIYRTGILMYGKKVSWGELYKWLFYKA